MSHKDDKSAKKEVNRLDDIICELRRLREEFHRVSFGNKICATCNHAENHMLYDDGGQTVPEQNVACELFKDDRGDLFVSPINNPGCLRWVEKETMDPDRLIAGSSPSSLKQELEFIKKSNCKD